MEELPTPVPAPGEARVRVAFAGVNFIDVYHRTGLYALPAPIRLGQEGAGVVEEVGAGVDLRPGAHVAWASVQGSYATHVIAPAAKLVRVPEGVPLADAAAVMLQGMTAHYLTRSTFRLEEGTTCLLHAAAGGVGLLVCQMARRAKARLFGTVSSDAKAALARDAGASEAIRYDRDDFEKEVSRLTHGRGVDVVYDSVGRDTWERSLRCLRPRGMLVLFGQSSGAVPPVDPLVLMRGSLFLTRPTLGHYVASPEELASRAGDLFAWQKDGSLHVRIDRKLPLTQAGDAHRVLESRATAGKVLLDASA